MALIDAINRNQQRANQAIEERDAYNRALASVPRGIWGYLTGNTASEIGEDVGGLLGSMKDFAKDNPVEFAAGFVPIVGQALALRDMARTQSLINQAEEQGDTATADRLRQMNAFNAAGLIPFGGGFARGSRRGFRGDTGRPTETSTFNASEIDPRFAQRTSTYDTETGRVMTKGQAGLESVGQLRPTGPETRVINNLNAEYQSRGINRDPVSIFNYEGRPYIITQSDRTAAGGLLTRLNGTTFNEPIDLRGGITYGLDPSTGQQVWASAPTVVDQIYNTAQRLRAETGMDPLLLTQRMAPTGGDFSTMTTETMMKYAAQNMEPSSIRNINRLIREEGRKISKKDANGNFYNVMVKVPEFKGIETPEGIRQLSDLTGDQRAVIQQILDLNRSEGGIGLTEARLAVSDTYQLNAPDTGIGSVGIIDTSQPVIPISGHPTYSAGLGGNTLGLLQEDIRAYQLLPDIAQERQLINPRLPSAEDRRSLSLRNPTGILTESLLRSLAQ